MRVPFCYADYYGNCKSSMARGEGVFPIRRVDVGFKTLILVVDER